MKRFLGLSVLAAGVALSGSQAQAATIVITPESEVKFEIDSNSNLSADEVCAAVGLLPGCFTSSYKSDFGTGESGSDLDDSYDTDFTPLDDDNEPTGAIITYVAGEPYFACGLCYLVVKDGNQGDPAQYIFDLANINGVTWNGQDTLQLEGFWDDGPGAISHVEILGSSVDTTDDDITVPEPSSALLFATGLAMVAERLRRRKQSQAV